MKKGQFIATIRRRARKGGVISAKSFKGLDRVEVQNMLGHMARVGELAIVKPGVRGPGGRAATYRALKLCTQDTLQPGRTPKRPPTPTPENGEIPIKQWCHEEGARLGLTPHAIQMRLQRGKYQNLKIRRANSYVVFVKV